MRIDKTIIMMISAALCCGVFALGPFDPFDEFDDPAPASEAAPAEGEDPFDEFDDAPPAAAADAGDPVAGAEVAADTAAADTVTSAWGFASGAAAPKKRAGWGKPSHAAFYSMRPECLLVSGEIATAGVVAEIGAVYSNGFFYSYGIGGGANYAGALGNVGFVSGGIDNVMKNIIGASGGFQYFWWAVNVKYMEVQLESETHRSNAAFGAGPFWKIMFGKNSNIDMTSRAMVGYTNNSVFYDESSYEVKKESGVSVMYGISIGYSLLGGK